MSGPAAAGGASPDLAGQAGRRAARTRLLGRLLVAEPDAEDAALARELPSLAGRIRDPAELRADYQRILLSGVSCYESVFRNPDGQAGGVDPALLAIYQRFDIGWQAHRVAAADHLGAQVLAYAQLCELEAQAWADDRPDRAGQVVEAQRTLLANHFGAWLPAASEAVARLGEGTAYAGLAALCDEVFAAEAELLRPAPQHAGMPAVEVAHGDAPQGGAARMTRRLLAPARAGGYLLAADVAPLAAALEAPWRSSDTRSRLRHVVDAALARGALALVAEAFAPRVSAWQDRWQAARDATPGAWRTFEAWRLRAQATLDWLADLGRSGTGGGPATLVVGSADRLAVALATLSAGGFAVATDPAPDAARESVDVLVRVEEGADDRWEGEPPVGAAARLAGVP